MSDPIHEKFVQLINRVEELEEMVSKLEGDERVAALEKLEEARNELARVSNGCGSPRPGM